MSNTIDPGRTADVRAKTSGKGKHVPQDFLSSSFC